MPWALGGFHWSQGDCYRSGELPLCARSSCHPLGLLWADPPFHCLTPNLMGLLRKGRAVGPFPFLEGVLCVLSFVFQAALDTGTLTFEM